MSLLFLSASTLSTSRHSTRPSLPSLLYRRHPPLPTLHHAGTFQSFSGRSTFSTSRHSVRRTLALLRPWSLSSTPRSWLLRPNLPYRTHSLARSWSALPRRLPSFTTTSPPPPQMMTTTTIGSLEHHSTLCLLQSLCGHTSATQGSAESSTRLRHSLANSSDALASNLEWRAWRRSM